MDNGPVSDTISLSLPVLQLAGEGGSVLGDDHDEEVAVLAVRGEHRPLLTDLAPVAARAGLGQGREVDAVGVTATPLKIQTKF